MKHTQPQQIAAIAAACAADPFVPEDLCRAVEDFVRPVMQHGLCTVNRADVAQMRVTRLYSSNPVAYPPGGSKDKRATAWGQQVLLECRPFVGEGAAAIRVAFDDHEAIARLGLQSVINVPVVFEGQCRGTLNLLMQTPAVSAEQLECAQLAALLLLPAFLR